MEKNGIEWLCPSCKKEKNAKEGNLKAKQPSQPKNTANSRVTGRQNSTGSVNSTMYGLIDYVVGKLFYLIERKIIFIKVFLYFVHFFIIIILTLSLKDGMEDMIKIG